MNGFTLIEVLIVVGIVMILVGLVVAGFSIFRKEADLGHTAEEIISALRLAQNKTLASEAAEQYGVHFETNKYVLFKGTVYNASATDNVIFNLPFNVEIDTIGLAGGQSEAIFERVSGLTEKFGQISLRLKSDLSQTKTIYLANSGQVSLEPIAAPQEAPLKDSRHIHFDYLRQINSASEKIILIFAGVSQEIALADNLVEGQIFWEGIVNADGANQQIKIHTHRLNDPVSGTQFCVHRDRRNNNRTLDITLSGDTSGNLISYTADGQESKGASIYLIGNPQRQ